MGKEMSNGAWVGCWAVILFAWFMSFAHGCADDKCPDGTSAKTLGFCHVPDGSGGKSVGAGGTGSIRFELGAAGSVAVDIGGHSGGKADSDSEVSDRDGGNGVVERGGAGGSAGVVGSVGVEIQPESAGGGQGGDVASGTATGSAGVGGAGNAGSAGAAHLQPTCGNGKRDPGELCDGDCPVDCDDGNACTMDVMTGSPATCDVFCGYKQVEEGTVCGNNAYCNNTGECLHNCEPGQPKCAGQPGTGSCVAASSFVMCDRAEKICVATWVPEGSTCGPGLTCDADHNCK